LGERRVLAGGEKKVREEEREKEGKGEGEIDNGGEGVGEREDKICRKV